MLDVWTPLPSSILAFVTTMHAAMLVLRKHRSRPSVAAYFGLVPPAAFASTPWVFPSLAGLGAGFVAHVAWFVVCERLTRVANMPAPPAGSLPSPFVTRHATGGTRQ